MSLPQNVPRPISSALSSPGGTALGGAVSSLAARSERRSDSGFSLIGSADLALSTRMGLIAAAQKTLDLQYYAIHADESTARILEGLRMAAQRGVRVRILLDDFNTAGNDAQVLGLAFEKNIEMRLFNPLPSGRSSAFFRIVSSLSDIARLQRRMHNKVFIADNAMAITGGRNLGDTYFGQSEGANFVDLDVLAAGRVVRDLSVSFDQYWNNPLAYPVQSLVNAKDIEAIKSRPPSQASGFGDLADTAVPGAQGTAKIKANLPQDADLNALVALPWTWAPSAILVDKPSKIALEAEEVEAAQDTAVDGLLQLMSQAKTDLLIVSPYFVPGQAMMKQFAEIRKRGVRVRVLTNSLASNDAVAAHAGYARYRRALLALGVDIYEMRSEQHTSKAAFGSGAGAGAAGSFAGGSSGSASGASRTSLHAKVVVIDQRLLVIGSMNLDLRSQLQNSEVAVVIRSNKLAQATRALIEPTLASGAYQVVLDGTQLLWRAPVNSGLPDATSEPDASVSQRLMYRLIGPFAPDEML